MKRLEFKSLLTRFDGNVPPALEIEKHFKVVRDLGEAEQVFERAGACETAGLQLISDENGAVGLALCFGEEDIYCLPAQGFLTSGYLADKAAMLCRELPLVCVLDLKSQLPFLKIPDDGPVMDAGVAGYLLNPLGDTYAYDDLARDYLGLTIPSQADLLGKEKLPASLAAGVEKAFDCACFMGYVAYKAAGPLTEKLREKMCIRDRRKIIP